MVAALKVDGYFVAYPGITGEVSDANGLTTLQVPVNFPTLAEALAFDPARVATVLGISGVKLIGSPLSRSQSDEYLVTYAFQGIASQSWTFEKSLTTATYSFRSLDTEVPIGAHPNFDQLRDKYGWEPDNLSIPDGPGHFPLYIEATNKISDLYGTDAWISTGAEYCRSLIAKTVPSSVYQDINKIVSLPPDFLTVLGSGIMVLIGAQARDFMKRGPNIEGLGGAFRIEERWSLSGPGGHNGDLYKYAGHL